MTNGDGVQATTPLDNLASMLVCFRHQTLDAVGFLIRLYHSNGLLSIIQHGHDRFVSDLDHEVFGWFKEMVWSKSRFWRPVSRKSA